MAIIGKNDFAKEINVTTRKLDSLMNDLNLEYETTPRDKKLKVVSDEAQEQIKDYLGME